LYRCHPELFVPELSGSDEEDEMSDYGSPDPEKETVAGSEDKDKSKAQREPEPSGQEHHNPETEEDTASGGPA
jgi:hypothetical protein